MLRFLGLFSIIPVTILLTVSFFVLFVLNKITSKTLRGFGVAIVILLWLSASLVLSLGIYTVATGQHPMMQMHRAMMKNMMMQPGMMHKPPAMQQDKVMPPAGSSMRHR
jgi:hypothetical protein